MGTVAQGRGGVQDYGLGPPLAATGALEHVLELRPTGTALEFGVAEGHTLRLIAETMPVIGFDSFAGLPERWRDGFEAGTFACEPPDVPGAQLVAGLFADTLPIWSMQTLPHIGLMHIDCDLYSSTVTVLTHLEAILRLDKPFVVFDEYHGYPGCEEHEMKAWREFADRTGITWTVIGHGVEQWAIQLTG